MSEKDELQTKHNDLINRIKLLRKFQDEATTKKSDIKAKLDLNKRMLEELKLEGKKLGVKNPEELMAMIVLKFDQIKSEVDSYGQKLKEEKIAFNNLENELNLLESE